MNFNRLTALRVAGSVSRVHTLPLHHRQTVGEHTYGVLCIIDAILDPFDLDMLRVVPLYRGALHHDACEGVLGDLPANVKWRFPKIEAAMKEAETEVIAEKEFFKLVPDSKEAKILKFADLMELAMFGLEEMALGNTRIEGVVDSALRALQTKGITEVTLSAKKLYEIISHQFSIRRTP